MSSTPLSHEPHPTDQLPLLPSVEPASQSLTPSGAQQLSAERGSSIDVPAPHTSPLTLSLPRISPETAKELKLGESDWQSAVASLEARLLGGERNLRRREVAAAAGVSLLSARKLWRAMGFPNFEDDDVPFTHADLVALTNIIDMVRTEQLNEDAAISITRAIGRMTDRMVVWQIEALVEELIANHGYTDAQARRRVVTQLPELLGPLEDALLYGWRRQMAAAVQRLAVKVEEGEEGSLPLFRAVGFCDLVSYTSMSRRMNERTLAQMVQRFENMAAEIITVGGGWLVKTIGDEVLYNAPTPEAGAQISLALASAFAKDEVLPEARVSMVWGRILSRLGDIYGPTVNLASRLTAIAEPGTVLTDAATAAKLAHDEHFILIPQPMRSVRGFGEVQPVILALGSGEGLVID